MSILIYFSIPAFLLLILAEWLRARHIQQPIYQAADSAACLAMGAGNVVIAALLKTFSLALLFLVYEFRLFDLPTGALWVWLLLFFAEDLTYYVFHRVHHESRLFWAAHVNHHSSEQYNLAVALRQSWTTPLTSIPFWLPLALLGFHPLMIITMKAISLLYQFWIHTRLINRLGPLEWFWNTPSHHRVHHGSNQQYIDKNYGGMLIIWDRLFGSFAAEDERVRYGLSKNITSFNPLKIAFHEFQAMAGDMRNANGAGNKLALLFRHPGWRPAGTATQATKANQAPEATPASEPSPPANQQP